MSQTNNGKYVCFTQGIFAETWRVVLERHGLKISRTKNEYLPSPTNDTETTVNIVDAELPTVTSFKYLGSIFTSEGGSQADVNNRIRIGWMKWNEVSGVMCDRKMPVKLKDKVFKTIIRPALTYGSECWAVKKKDENKLNSAEMRMLRWARGNTRLDHIRNEDIRKDADVKPVQTFLENKRLKWFGHCLRTQPHLCEIAKNRGFWEKEQRPTEKEMEGQHTGRHEEIPTDRRHGTISKILDD